MSHKTLPEQSRLARIKLLMFDFDGVLTDNHVFVSENGERMKRFWVPDGVGIFMAHKAGLKLAIITGNDDGATRHRAEFLRIDDLYQGVRNKVAVYEELKAKYELTDDECMFVGDDLPDLGVFRRAGVTLAPPDSHPTILEVADWVGLRMSGKGIVREAIDAILDAKGFDWEEQETKVATSG